MDCERSGLAHPGKLRTHRCDPFGSVECGVTKGLKVALSAYSTYPEGLCKWRFPHADSSGSHGSADVLRTESSSESQDLLRLSRFGPRLERGRQRRCSARRAASSTQQVIPRRFSWRRAARFAWRFLREAHKFNRVVWRSVALKFLKKSDVKLRIH